MSSEISRGKEKCLSSKERTKLTQIKTQSETENNCFQKSSKITDNYTNY